MTQVKSSSTKIATKWAFVGLAITIVITYAFEWLNIDPNSAAKHISWVPFIAFLLLTQKEYRDELGGYMTFGQGFSAGFRYAVFAGLLTALFTFLYLKFSPGAWDKMLEAMQTEMESKGNTESEVEMGMDMMKKGGILIITFSLAVMYTLMGAILSLIGAAIFKKERPLYDNDDAVVSDEPAV